MKPSCLGKYDPEKHDPCLNCAHDVECRNTKSETDTPHRLFIYDRVNKQRAELGLDLLLMPSGYYDKRELSTMETLYGELLDQKAITPSSDKVKPEKWAEFRNSGLLWWVNQQLHLFGWAIVLNMDGLNNVTSAFPARVKFRGFSAEANLKGYYSLTQHMASNAEELKSVFVEEQN